MEYSKFFNAVEIAPGVYDRVYEESDFADYFGSVLTTGLLHTNYIPGLDVSAEGYSLNTVVSPGKAIIKGHLYENTTPLILSHNIPEATLDRIDAIVLRMDVRNQSRFIKLFIKEGIPSSNPVLPDLQRDSFIYELCIATVRIKANTASIQQSDILDTRFEDELCGLTYSLLSGPLGDLSANMVKILDPSNSFVSNNIEGALAELAQPLTIRKSGYDVNAVFTKIVFTNSAGVTVKQSVLSNPDSNGNYLIRTVTHFGKDGVTVVKTEVYDIVYNADGNIVSEVLR